MREAPNRSHHSLEASRAIESPARKRAMSNKQEFSQFTNQLARKIDAAASDDRWRVTRAQVRTQAVIRNVKRNRREFLSACTARSRQCALLLVEPSSSRTMWSK